jgi:hypothetical protein
LLIIIAYCCGVKVERVAFKLASTGWRPVELLSTRTIDITIYITIMGRSKILTEKLSIFGAALNLRIDC